MIGRITENSYALLSVSKEELQILNNALNEVCNGIDVPEFSIRMGAKREEVLSLLAQINQLLTKE